MTESRKPVSEAEAGELALAFLRAEVKVQPVVPDLINAFYGVKGDYFFFACQRNAQRVGASSYVAVSRKDGSVVLFDDGE